ncbi:MAG: SsrA-binding protein SmpB [Candidatus Brocadiae bacterium]|nr:SsrA-binding protein SmpB [Candidatus Brocadiia bacterium]
MPRKPPEKPDDVKVIARNRRARFEYTILDTVEAGLVLKGSEVKSIRAGNVQIQGAFARVEDGEAWLYEMEVAEYVYANLQNHEPKRVRKLLLRKPELRKLQAQMMEKGLTIVALALLFRRGLVKIELGVGRGKKLFDKREDLKKREAKRDIERSGRR